MSYKILFIISAIVLFAFGILLVVAPKVGLEQFRMDARATEVFLTRVVGAALASLGLVLFFARGADDAGQKYLGIAALAGAVLGLIVTLIGITGGLIRENGWTAVIVELLFAVGYVFALFVQPRLQQQ